jgi:Tfp pilus assembly protein FimT
MMIVMTVAAILGTISIGPVHDMIIQQRAYRASTAVQNDLEAAYALAVRNRQPVRIEWDASTMQLNIKDGVSGTILRHADLGSDAYRLDKSAVTYTDTNGESKPVTVYSNGLADHGMTLTLTATLRNDQTTQRIITMTRSGIVKVELKQ